MLHGASARGAIVTAGVSRWQPGALVVTLLTGVQERRGQMVRVSLSLGTLEEM